MKITLWSVQILLAVAFVAFGLMKVTMPLDELASRMAWVSSAPPWLPRFIGAAEILGAFGLILPAVTRILPGLVVLAASSLALVMVLAVGTHVLRNEPAMSVPALVLGSLAVFVAYGRARIAPIQSRAGAVGSHPQLER